MSRPEHEAPPEIVSTKLQPQKSTDIDLSFMMKWKQKNTQPSMTLLFNIYHHSTRMVEIQSQMTNRALEMLMIPPAEEGGPKLLLDIGCGSGLSGEVIEESGHTWIGLDISKSMLGKYLYVGISVL